MDLPSGPRNVGVTLALDAVAVDVSSALTDAGVPSILLKGPAIGRWLYDEAGERLYDDVDLLVRASQLDLAERTLRVEAFRFVHDDGHGRIWQRGPVNVDLHRRLAGSSAPADLVFDALLGDSEWLELPRGSVRTLGPSARALHLALHAAQHGAGSGSHLDDLTRGLERLPEETWRSAADLARQVGAVDGLAAGLALVPQGESLRAQLGLEPRWRDAEPPVTKGLLHFFATRGARRKLALLVTEVAPTSSYLRAHVPLARRGRLGLWAARLARPFVLLFRLGPALRAALRSRDRRPF